MIIDVDDATPSTTNKRVTFSILQNAAQTPWATNIDADDKILDNLTTLIQNTTATIIPLEEYGLQVLNDDYILQLGTIIDEFQIKFTDDLSSTIPYTFSLTTFTAPNITVDSNLFISDSTANPTQNGEITNNAGDVIIQSGGTDINISDVGTPPFSDVPNLIVSAVGTDKAFKVDVSGATDSTLTVLSIANAAGTNIIQLPDATGTVVLEDNIQNLENKSIDLTDNTLTGTKTEFNTALSDDDFAYLDTSNTFTAAQAINATSANLSLTGSFLTNFTATLARNAAAGPFSILRKARGTGGSELYPVSGDFLGVYRFSGFDEDTSDFVAAAEIQCRTTENWTATEHGTRFVFRQVLTGTDSIIDVMGFDGATGIGDFNIGVEAPFYQTATANIADAEAFRLARIDSIAWRNEGNSANLLLSVNSSNQLTFDGAVIAPPFDDTTILIQDATNNDRTFQLAVGSSATSNTVLQVNSSDDRNMNLPDASGSIPLLETNNVFTNSMTNLRDGTGGAFTLINFDDQDFDDMQLEFKRGKGTQSLSTPVDVDTFLGSIIFQGLGTSFFIAGASITAIATETFTNSTAATKLLFATTPTTTSTPVTRLVIEPTGIFDFQSNSIINVTLTSPVITGGQLDTTVGFFGTTPIPQESVASDTLANLYTALRAYGIIA